MKYFELEIARTAKKYKSKEKFECYDNEIKKFKTIEALQEWVNENYKPKMKKAFLFSDTENGTVRCGWLYRYIGGFYKEVGKFTCEDWLTISEVLKSPVTV